MERKLKKLHDKCKAAESKLTSACESLAAELQIFFFEDVTVFYQPSDGFVVLHGDAENTTVDEVIFNICNDGSYYLNKLDDDI